MTTHYIWMDEPLLPRVCKEKATLKHSIWRMQLHHTHFLSTIILASSSARLILSLSGSGASAMAGCPVKPANVLPMRGSYRMRSHMFNRLLSHVKTACSTIVLNILSTIYIYIHTLPISFPNRKASVVEGCLGADWGDVRDFGTAFQGSGLHGSCNMQTSVRVGTKRPCA